MHAWRGGICADKHVLYDLYVKGGQTLNLLG